MASTQEVEMLRRQLDELTAQMIEMRQQSSSTAMNAAVTGLAEAVRTMGQSVSKPRPEDMRVGKPEPYAPGKDFDDWDFTFNGYAGTLDPAYPALLKTARQSPTVMATPPHEQQSATLLYLLTMLTQKGARKVVRKAGNNGFVEAVHGHIEAFARCYQTQIETNTGIQLSAISPAIPFAIRHAGFVLSRFTVRPDGRTPFQYLLGTPYVSPLCMFGKSVFALIPDHEVRAAKLTNRWISGCWWRRDASSDEHLVGTKHGLLSSADQFAENHLQNNGVNVKRSKLEGRSGILMWKWILEYLDPLEPRRDEGLPTATAPTEILQYLHLHLRLENTYPRCEFTAKAEEATWRPR